MYSKRRELLKALTLGGGAVAATQLPTTWTKPVVDSVTLPVHAQTTSETEPVPECELVQTIRGATVSCADSVFSETRYYAIRSADAPCGFQVTESSSDPGFPYVRISLDRTATLSGITITSFDTGGSQIGGDFGATLQCSTGIESIDPLPLTAQDENGQNHTVSGTLSTTESVGGEATMSILTVAPD